MEKGVRLLVVKLQTARLHDLLSQARAGDQEAFAALLAVYQRQILTHCYRMLGSPQDAEDALQETAIRVWQRLSSYTGKGSFQSWLYAIATNVCLDLLRKQASRALIQTNTPPLDGLPEQLQPLPEAIWLEPFPDELLPEVGSTPEAIYSMRESVNLAFMTILHRLPPKQRAVLLLRDVLNWKAQEVAAHLDMTVSAVNSALIRARKTLQDANYSNRYRSRPSDDVIQGLLDQYIVAWETANIPALIALLKEDALLTMPPLPFWFQGRTPIREFFARFIFASNAKGSWRLQQQAANGQPACALYRLNETTGQYDRFCLVVLTVADHQFARLDHFMTPHESIAGQLESNWLRFFNLEKQLVTTRDPNR